MRIAPALCTSRKTTLALCLGEGDSARQAALGCAHLTGRAARLALARGGEHGAVQRELGRGAHEEQQQSDLDHPLPRRIER
jgi:hypothetical protein